MGILLIVLIVVLSGVICTLAGFWFYRAAQERKQDIGQPQIAPEMARRSIRNAAWDHAVRSARNRNW